MYINHIKDFADKMEQAFKAYVADGCLDFSRPRYDRFHVSKQDSAYLWAALDGAMRLHNIEHPKAGEQLCFEDGENTDEYDEYIIGYYEDVYGCNA